MKRPFSMGLVLLMSFALIGDLHTPGIALRQHGADHELDLVEQHQRQHDCTHVAMRPSGPSLRKTAQILSASSPE